MSKHIKIRQFFLTNFNDNIFMNKFIYYFVLIQTNLHIDILLDHI